MLVYAVVGSSSGLGLELVRQLLAAGDESIVIATTREPNEAVELQELKQKHGERLRIYRLDYGDRKEESVKDAVQAIARDVVGIDVLINNAGVAGAPTLALETPLQDLRDTLEINTVAPLAVLREFLPLLRKRQTRKVALITSILGSNEFNHSLINASNEEAEKLGKIYLSYKTAKAALNMLVTVIANELAAEDFKIVSLHPGHCITYMGSLPGLGTPTLAPEHSVAGQLRVIAGLTPEDTGRYLDSTGKTMAF